MGGARWWAAAVVLAAFGVRPAEAAEAAFAERGLRLVRNVPPSEHGGRSQTFSVTEDGRGVLYAGNLEGVLEFDGARWRVLTLPNSSAVFAVAPGPDGRVYVGAWDELGVLSPEARGELRFVSLTDRLPKGLRPLGKVRGVHAVEKSVCYRTESRLFLWDGKSMRIVPAAPGGAFGGSFDVGGGEVWVETADGLARIRPEGLTPLPEAFRFPGRHVEALVPTGTGARLAVLRGAGMFLLDGSGATPVAPETARWLDSREVEAGTLLPDGRIALATRRAGVVVLGSDFSVDETAGIDEGLPGNDALGLHVARDGALWVAQDSGLSRVELASPVSVFDRRTGLEGTAMSVTRHAGRLYVSTTAGLFALEAPPSGATRRSAARFVRVEGVEPGCFGAASLGDDLLVATRSGVFVVGAGRTSRLPGTEGLATYAVVASRRFPGVAWLGLYDGLGVLRKEASRYRLERYAEGAGGPIRVIFEESGESGTVWLGSVFRGILRARFSGPAERPHVTPVGEPGEATLLPGRDGFRAIVAGKGVFRIDPAAARLVPDPVFAAVAGDGDLFLGAEDSLGNVWLNTVPPSVVVRRDGVLRGERRLVPQVPGRDFQALVTLEDTVWLSSELGLFRYQVSSSPPPPPLPRPLVRRVVAGRGTLLFGGSGAKAAGAPAEVPANERRIRFECAPLTHYAPVAFQVLLEGAERDWSDPSAEASREYTNLWEGSYAFRVRTRDAQGVTSPEAVYRFRVLPPWYRTPLALALWFGLAVAAVVGAIRLRLRTLRRRNALLTRRVEERTRELGDAVAQLGAARTQVEERNAELAAANEKLTSLSYLDGLTGVANRRHFDETLAREWSRAARGGSSLSVVMVDVDHFKKLNDLLGHPEGDRCLREVARVLASGAARAGDLAARFGGEEFVLLLPQTSIEGAAHLAEELRRGIEALALPNPGSPFGVLTASFGVASFVPRDGGLPAELLAAADEALYDAKATGRNRVAEG